MKGQLPNWLAEWFGVKVPGDGDVAVWELQHAWHGTPGVTTLVILLAVGWTFFCYRLESRTASRSYRIGLASLRVAALAILLFMLAEFALSLQRAGRPRLVLLVDRSASMATADDYEPAALNQALLSRLEDLGQTELTRLNLAKLLLIENDAELLKQLTDTYETNIYYVAGDLVPATRDVPQLTAEISNLSATGASSQATQLGQAIRQVLTDTPGGLPAAVILLSDGINTAGPSLEEAATLARRKGVPLIAVGLGVDRPPRDVEISDLLVDDVVFVDDLVRFSVTLKSSGLGGQQVRTTLRRGDDPAVLAEQLVTLEDSGSAQTVNLTHRPTEPGDADFVVRVDPVDQEIDLQNNDRRQVVSVRDEKIRVLLAQNYPSYEFRYLKALLERDPTVELATYLQEADPDYVTQDQSAVRLFPLQREAMLEYDVVILGDVDPRLLPRSVWENLQTFVEDKGGGLVMIAGPRFMPWTYDLIPEIQLLAPVELSAVTPPPANVADPFTVQPTPLGLRAPSMQLGDSPAQTATLWRGLEPLYWLAEVGPTKPAAQVLAEHPTRTGPDGRRLPILCLQYVGNGRVLLHATDETWRWRFRVGDVFFARYWVQTIRMLARAKLISREGAELTVDRREYRTGEPIQLRVRFMDERLAPTVGDRVAVLLESVGLPRRRVALSRHPTMRNVFEGSLAGLGAARYRVLLAEPPGLENPPSTTFAVSNPPGETAHLEMDRARLAHAAENTRGTFYTIDTADRLVDELPRGRRIPIENLPAAPLWNRNWLITLLLGLFTSEWILRRRKGML